MGDVCFSFRSLSQHSPVIHLPPPCLLLHTSHCLFNGVNLTVVNYLFFIFFFLNSSFGLCRLLMLISPRFVLYSSVTCGVRDDECSRRSRQNFVKKRGFYIKVMKTCKLQSDIPSLAHIVDMRTWQEMKKRKKLTAVPFTFRKGQSGNSLHEAVF